MNVLLIYAAIVGILYSVAYGAIIELLGITLPTYVHMAVGGAYGLLAAWWIDIKA
jgi:hypothetical protein